MPGIVLLSLRDEDKPYVNGLAALLKKLDFKIYGTHGTIKDIEGAHSVPKIGKGDGKPDILDLIVNKQVSLVINTPTKGGRANTDGFRIRRTCLEKGIPCITNVNTTFELLKALIELKEKNLELEVRHIEEYWQ